MSEINSGASDKFGFVMPNKGNDKQKDLKEEVTSPETTKETPVLTVQENIDVKLNEPYLDKRKVTISLVRNYSKYREANRTALPTRVDYIGSSISSSRILSSRKGEVEAYFPQIIGLSPSDPSFIARVKQYLNNIQIIVDGTGRVLDISFNYKTRAAFNEFTRKEEEIEEAYKLADKRSTTDRRAALKEKITALDALESTKWAYGSPVNVEEYLTYRHCLLYNDIAKDTALINVDSSIRFFFKDDRREAEKLRKLRQEVNKAKANYVNCLADNELFDAIYTQYCVMNNLPVIPSLREDPMQKEIKLDAFSQAEPVKFNKMFNNKDIKLIGKIENLIARGELVRSSYNQNVTDVDGSFIGANMLEVVGWFKNPENGSKVNVYFNKLKNI